MGAGVGGGFSSGMGGASYGVAAAPATSVVTAAPATSVVTAAPTISTYGGGVSGVSVGSVGVGGGFSSG